MGHFNFLETGRRRFLGGATLLGISTCARLSWSRQGNLFPASNQTETGNRGSLIELRQAAKNIGEAGTFCRFRDDLLACAINPWVKTVDWSDLPDYFEAMVEIRQPSTETKIVALLDYCEGQRWVSDIEGRLSFMEWLKAFKPLNRHECAMALPLYHDYRLDGIIVPIVQPTPDTWLDAFLKDTRGILFWRDQLVELIRMVTGKGDLTNRIAKALRTKNANTLPDAMDALRKARYFGTGQSLLEIIDERSVRGVDSYWGTPDYIVGDWLLQYLSQG